MPRKKATPEAAEEQTPSTEEKVEIKVVEKVDTSEEVAVTTQQSEPEEKDEVRSEADKDWPFEYPRELIEDSNGLLPDEKGYDQFEVTRGIREKISLGDNLVKDQRTLLQYVLKEHQASKPRPDGHNASHQTAANRRRLQQKEMDRRRKVEQTLREMNLIPQ